MIFAGGGTKVYVATKPVDFRKGMDSLSVLVEQSLGLDPHNGAIYVFRSKRSDRLKVLVWDGTGLVIYDGYGQTESVILVANFRCNEVRPGSMGLPAPGFTIGVVDEQGNEAPTGEEGQIAVKIKPERPVGLFQEYWRDSEAMERSFVGGAQNEVTPWFSSSFSVSGASKRPRASCCITAAPRVHWPNSLP